MRYVNCDAAYILFYLKIDLFLSLRINNMSNKASIWSVDPTDLTVILDGKLIPNHRKS